MVQRIFNFPNNTFMAVSKYNEPVNKQYGLVETNALSFDIINKYMYIYIFRSNAVPNIR